MTDSKRTSRPRVGEERDVIVDDLAYGGDGVGRLGSDGGGAGMVVFVRRAAVGDRARVRIEDVKRRHAEASIVEVVEPGPGRTDPPCPHYEEGCGGCSWQHLDYDAQLAAKESVVRDSLERIGGFTDPPIAPIVGADEPWFYRNKMEFSFNASDGLGLHVAGDWRCVVPVTECRLESELAMRVVELAGDFAAEHDLALWDPAAEEGFLRELVVRQGRNTGETMVGLVTAPGPFPEARSFADGVAGLDASIVSVVRAVRGDGSGGKEIESVETLRGRDAIVERVAGLSFEIGLRTFFQPNTAQAERLADEVGRRVEARLDPADERQAPARVLDLFCGVGFFSMILARVADRVIGVEMHEASVAAARENARRNDVDNAVFHAGTARAAILEVVEEHGAPDVVVLNPPRAGAGQKLANRIGRSAPRRIVYVSCNPTTLARDLKELAPDAYRITDVQPLDLFPQTYHVETIVTLDRRDDA